MFFKEVLRKKKSYTRGPINSNNNNITYSTKNMNKRALLQALITKRDIGLNKQAVLEYGDYGAIIGAPTGALLGYKGMQMFTDNKTWKIIGALAGALGGGLTGYNLGDQILRDTSWRQTRDLRAKAGIEDQLRQIKNNLTSPLGLVGNSDSVNSLLHDIRNGVWHLNRNSAK